MARGRTSGADQARCRRDLFTDPHEVFTWDYEEKAMDYEEKLLAGR
jgi:hypothetical protein